MKKTKKKSHSTTQKSKEADFNDLLVQAARTGVALIKRGLFLAEVEAKKRGLFTAYPFLRHALVNVSNVVEMMQTNLKAEKPQKKHARRKTKKGN